MPKAVILSLTWIPASSAGEPGETRLTTTIGVWFPKRADDELAEGALRTSGGIFVDVKVSFDSWKYFSRPASIDFVSSFKSFCKHKI